MKLVKCELESHKKFNGSWEINKVDTDADGDEVKIESTREEEVMEDFEVESEWEANETVQEEHEHLVEGGEDYPTREESNEGHVGLSVEMWETSVEPSGDDKHLHL